MAEKKVPYAVQISKALLAGKPDEAHHIIGGAMAEMVGGICRLVQSYGYLDLPIAIAALRVSANALESTIDERGKELADTVYQRTESIVINTTGMKKGGNTK